MNTIIKERIINVKEKMRIFYINNNYSKIIKINNKIIKFKLSY